MPEQNDDQAIELEEYPLLAGASAEIVTRQERQPLIRSTSSPSSSSTPRHNDLRGLSTEPVAKPSIRESIDDSSIVIDFMMEKFRDSKVARFADKLAVDHEPGLTTTQLMVRIELSNIIASHEKPPDPIIRLASMVLMGLRLLLNYSRYRLH
jgi:hypothetical protein